MTCEIDAMRECKAMWKVLRVAMKFCSRQTTNAAQAQRFRFAPREDHAYLFLFAFEYSLSIDPIHILLSEYFERRSNPISEKIPQTAATRGSGPPVSIIRISQGIARYDKP